MLDLKEEHNTFSLHDDVDNRKIHGAFNTFEFRGDLEVFGRRKASV